MPFIGRRLLTIIALSQFILAPSQAESGAAAEATGPAGTFVGEGGPGLVKFLGIPYAEPPTARLRWMPPKPKGPMAKPFIAKGFGSQCPQSNTLATFGGPVSSNEDCLYLNVYAPRFLSGGEKKYPVLVWLHGGGNFMGSADAYDPSSLVKRGLVVVTVNSRLGLFGWMAHTALAVAGRSTANYGLMDQQLALRWVKENIAGFSGDPQRVTIAGESAGSLNSQAHMVSPKSKGLFHRAIWQSGVSEAMSLSEAEALGTAFAEAAGCRQKEKSGLARCLRSLSAEKVMELQGAENKFFGGEGLVADGKVIPAVGIRESFRRGSFHPVPVLSSSTLNEYNFVIGVQQFYQGANAKELNESDYNAFVGGLSKGKRALEDEIKQAYPLSSFTDAQAAISAIGTASDSRFECSMRERLLTISKKSPVYFYLFADVTAPSLLPKLVGYRPMADHTSDIQYLFHGFHGGPEGVRNSLNEEQLKLSNELLTAWAEFANSGTPGPASAWPRFFEGAKGPVAPSFQLPKPTLLTDQELLQKFKCAEWKRWKSQANSN